MNIIAIAPATRTVALGSAAVEVSGLSLRKLSQLIVTYPALLNFVAGGSVDFASLLFDAPNMALAIFAVGVVGPSRPRWWRPNAIGNEEDDLLKAFDTASVAQQMEILTTIVDLTFKGGERGIPFLKSVIGSLATSTPSLDKEPSVPKTETETAIPAEPMPTSSSD